LILPLAMEPGGSMLGGTGGAMVHRCMHLMAALVLVACPAAQAAATPVGMNLAGVTYYSTEYPFVDLFRMSQPLVSQKQGAAYAKGDPQEMRDDGYPRRLAPGHFMDALMCVGNPHYRAGRYVCLYEGSGTITFGMDARVVAERPGRLEIDVRPRDGISLAIRRTDPANPVRNIRVVAAEFEQTYDKEPFDPVFLATWRGMRVLRFMDWMKTNGSKVSQWQDRPQVTDQTQGRHGVALEHMIDLANRLEADPWFCMPHLATDDYVRRFAVMAKERLAANRKVYIEYSNETWNGMFEQARYAQRRGRELGLADNPFQAGLRYHAQRALETFRIWEEVFGGKDRLVRVLSAQAANPWTSEQVLTWKEAFKSADAIAIGAYFGHEFGNPRQAERTATMSVEALLAACGQALDREKPTLARQGDLARKHGLKLIAYEWGQHLVGHGGAENHDKLRDLFIAANRHPGMKALYLEHMNNWQQAGGELCVVFSSTTRPNKWGSWGVLEYQGQDIASAPKMQALREAMESGK
jgi:hypothetical protein